MCGKGENSRIVEMRGAGRMALPASANGQFRPIEQATAGERLGASDGVQRWCRCLDVQRTTFLAQRQSGHHWTAAITLAFTGIKLGEPSSGVSRRGTESHFFVSRGSRWLGCSVQERLSWGLGRGRRSTRKPPEGSGQGETAT